MALEQYYQDIFEVSPRIEVFMPVVSFTRK